MLWVKKDFWVFCRQSLLRILIVDCQQATKIVCSRDFIDFAVTFMRKVGFPLLSAPFDESIQSKVPLLRAESLPCYRPL
ncbi:hypothetical protein Q31b_24990 [Novipirellula aureliae]|uniref:Uncharacterized protein n=1 Tax=Novipirellula aureliae TaxID=2527966 RepID=A0A5C6E3J2_9BACT|nr:hypothetical protein Q31b_24990 [Novipirellula aureliae]